MSQEIPAAARAEKRRLIPVSTLILLVIIAVAGVGGMVYVTQIRQPAAEIRELSNQLTVQMVGLESPVKNELDPRYTDANGDGVADTPTDAAKLLDPDMLTFSFVAGEDSSAHSDTFKEFVSLLCKTTGKQVQLLH